MPEMEDQTSPDVEQVEVEEQEDDIQVEIEGAAPVVKPPVPPVNDADIRFKNKVYAQDRIINSLRQEIDKLKTVQPQQPEPMPTDELDALAQKDWKAAVSKLADQRYEERRRQEQASIQQSSQQERFNMALQENVGRVVSRYNQLEDPASEYRQIYDNVLNNHPEWRSSINGPLNAQDEMEKELERRGLPIYGKPSSQTNREQVRQTTASASSLPHSQQSTKKTIVLTAEQQQFCDAEGLDYKEYARMLQGTEGTHGGVNV